MRALKTEMFRKKVPESQERGIRVRATSVYDFHRVTVGLAFTVILFPS